MTSSRSHRCAEPWSRLDTVGPWGCRSCRLFGRRRHPGGPPRDLPRRTGAALRKDCKRAPCSHATQARQARKTDSTPAVVAAPSLGGRQVGRFHRRVRRLAAIHRARGSRCGRHGSRRRHRRHSRWFRHNLRQARRRPRGVDATKASLDWPPLGAPPRCSRERPTDTNNAYSINCRPVRRPSK